MNIIDIIIRGFSKGFVDQAYSLVALIAGVWLSFKFSGALGDWLVSFADLPAGVLHLIAFAVILLAVMFLVHLAGNVVEKLLKFVMLGWLNKLLGIVFAIIKAVLVVGLVIILFDALNNTIPLVKETSLSESILYQPVKDIANTVFPYLKELIFKK